MTHKQVYEKIYQYKKREFALSPYWVDYNPLLTVKDNASRMANIYAVQNTRRLWAMQDKIHGHEISFMILDEILEG